MESVLNQTFKDLEIIIINDGSQDATLEIVAQIRDPRIKVFSYPNSGPNPSRNRGVGYATGEYLAFIDADDLWTPDKLECQLKALKENPQAALAYSWTNYIDESGQFLYQGSYMTVNGDVYAKLLLIDFISSGSNPLIRKQALVELGGFEESLTHGEDWDMWLRLAKHYHFVAVPSPQILYRKSVNSWSSNIDRMEAGGLKVIERAFTQAPDSLAYLKQYSLANFYKGLTLKALEGTPGPQKGLTAARFLWHAFIADYSLLRARVIGKVLFKITLMVLLPPQPAHALLSKMQQLSNINALHGYMRVEPSQLG
jgi:glycosyltransferase involved in cell wall biosynthesis